MKDSDPQSLDEIIAIYLDGVDSGDQQNPENFIEQWPHYRTDFLHFVAQNKVAHRLMGHSSNFAESLVGASSPNTEIAPLLHGYRLGRIIGRGGMATVYEAIRIRDDERVAIKVLSNRPDAGRQYRQRFEREAQAIESLVHPNIVPLYGVGQSEDTQYLIMKLIVGVTLADLVIQSTDSRPEAAKCLSAAQRQSDCFSTVGRLIADIAGALEAAHQANIIHRDIKPSNLLLDEQGKVWLTDFGLASVGEGHTNLTATGDLLGTPAYMSPEQASGNHHEVDHRTDIYSLGATLYALATHQQPYAGSGVQVLRAVSDGFLKPPSRLRQDLPQDLEAIILKAMSRNPGKRYQSAAALEQDLRHFASGRSVSAKSPGPMDRAVQWTSRNPRAAITTLISLVAIVFSVILIQTTVSYRLAGLNEKLSNTNQKLSELNADLVASQRTLERNLYGADMSEAYRAFAHGDIDRSRELLARYGPDGNRADLAGFEWRLLEELSRPPKIRRIQAHAAAARDLAVLSGSTQFVTVADDGSIRHAELNSPTQLVGFNVDGQLAAIAVSPDRRSFVIGQNVVDGTNPVTLRDLKTGQVLQELTGHEYAVESVAFSPSGKLVATAGRYQDVLIHSVDGTLQHRLTTGSRNESLAFSPDEKYLLTVFRMEDDVNTQLLRIWDLKSFQPAFDLKTDFFPTTFALSEAGSGLIVADSDHVAKLAFPSGTMLALHESLRGRIRDVAISSDGRRYAAGCDNGLIYLWDLWGNASEPEDENNHGSPVEPVKPFVMDTGGHGITSLRFLSDRELIASNTSGETLICETRSSQRPPESVNNVGRFVRSSLTPGRGFARLDNGAVVQLQVLPTRGTSVKCLPQAAIINGEMDDDGPLALSPNETMVAVGTRRELIVADTRTNETLASLRFPVDNKSLRDLKFSSCGRWLLSLFNDHVRVYNTWDWTMYREIRLPNENARRLGTAPESTGIFVLSERELLLYTTPEFTLEKSFSNAGASFSALAITHSGETCALGCIDGTTQLINAKTLDATVAFHGHRSRIHSMQFYGNDQSLMSCDIQGELRLWDLIGYREKALLNTGSAQCQILEEVDALVAWGSGKPLRVWTAGRKIR